MQNTLADSVVFLSAAHLWERFVFKDVSEFVARRPNKHNGLTREFNLKKKFVKIASGRPR